MSFPHFPFDICCRLCQWWSNLIMPRQLISLSREMAVSQLKWARLNQGLGLHTSRVWLNQQSCDIVAVSHCQFYFPQRMSSELVKIACFSRPARGSTGSKDGFDICRQGHALYEGITLKLARALELLPIIF